MTKKFSVPRGTNDILPGEVAIWQKNERLARQVLHSYGYQEIRTPIFEETSLFTRSMGETSDVVQKQMLNLAKNKQDSAEAEVQGFSLRPEGTAAVVRSYIENNLDRKESISKLYYLGPMFRGERPQKGRLRQFHQVGAEAIGPNTASPYLDAEIIALSVHLLKSFGLNNFRLKINSLGTPEDKEKFSRMLREQLRPEASHLCEDCQQRLERNVFRVLDCKNKICREIVDRKIKFGNEYLSKDSQDYYAGVRTALESLKIPYEQSARLVRGLDYYTHTVFEISDPSLGSQDALGAGGRYNNLVSQLGGAEVDAIGFALGMERIILAMPKTEEAAKEDAMDAFLIALDEQARAKGFEILNTLRSYGVSADMNYRIASLKSLMRSADKSQARQVLILGENEIAQQVITLKNMSTGEQSQHFLQDLSQLAKILKK